MNHTLSEVKTDVKRFYSELFSDITNTIMKREHMLKKLHSLSPIVKGSSVTSTIFILLYIVFPQVETWARPVAMAFLGVAILCFLTGFIITKTQIGKLEVAGQIRIPLPLGVLVEDKDISNAIRDAELIDVDIVNSDIHEALQKNVMSYILYFSKKDNVVCVDSMINCIDVCPSADGILHVARKADRVTIVAVPETIIKNAKPLFPENELAL